VLELLRITPSPVLQAILVKMQEDLIGADVTWALGLNDAAATSATTQYNKYLKKSMIYQPHTSSITVTSSSFMTHETLRFALKLNPNRPRVRSVNQLDFLIN